MDCKTCRTGSKLEPSLFPSCDSCGGVGRVELDPQNERPLDVLRLAAPSFQFGFNVQALADAAFILDITLTRRELLRIHRAWTATWTSKD